MVDLPRVDPPHLLVDPSHLLVDPPHLPGQSAPSNLRGRRTGEMGRIDHGGVRGRSTPLEWVDLISPLVKEAVVAAVTTVSSRQCRQSPPGLPPYPDESLN